MMDARHITETLGGRWHGSFGLACCPAHDNSRTPALSLRDGTDGRLLAHCHAGCSFAAVLDALRGRGIRPGTGDSMPASMETRAKRAAQEEAEANKREGQARGLWQEAQPICGTIGATYLRGRSITCPLPDTLRFHPGCWHGPSARRLPAMVALVEGPPRLAVHRTYLRADGTGKADLPAGTAKLCLGAVGGGAVRLSDATGPLVIAEGIETALSLGSGLLDTPARIWAALSTSGMAALRLPCEPGRLIIATDGDGPGKEAGTKLATRAASLRWTVSLLPAPQGRDWNDILMMPGARQ